MPTPLKYVKDPKAKDPTARARVKIWRLRKAGHIFEGICPVCTEELRQMGIDRARPCNRVTEDDTIAEAKRRQESRARSRAIERKCLGLDLIDEFNLMTGGNVTLIKGGTDYESARLLWKRNAALLHPDRKGGDAVKATRLNELWTTIQKIKGWDQVKGATA